MRFIVVFCFLFFEILFYCSCSNGGTGNIKEVSSDNVYFDYKIWADDASENATIKLQYKIGGPEGTTLLLEEPAKVLMDGEPIPMDSTGFEGAFYETMKPIKRFIGKHTIEFTDAAGKTYTESFTYQPFSLNPDMPESLMRADLVFHFDGMEAEDYLHVSAVDTSFESKDINRVDTLVGGNLLITKSRLEQLVDGPVTIEFHKETELPLKNATREGGMLKMNYSLRRQFELKSTPD